MKIVTAGIIFCQNKILIAKRSTKKKPPYLWEFPGGKLEENETMPQCLQREIMEEFSLPIIVGDYFASSTFEYEFGTFQINAFFAQAQTQEIKDLNSHDDYKWVDINELSQFEFAPADVPLVDKLILDSKP